MIKDFKDFAIKGNVIDLATGVIIGGAFGKIVTSLVNDIIMPLIGLLLGGADFTTRYWTLRHAKGDQPDLILEYGVFIQSVIDFLIVAFSIFIFVRLINKINLPKIKEETIEEVIIEVEPEEPAPTKEEILLTEIRDLLKQK